MAPAALVSTATVTISPTRVKARLESICEATPSGRVAQLLFALARLGLAFDTLAAAADV
jgi:hypothetical protein